MPQELRFALRMLGKQPGFTAIAVLTLAIGIGATAAVFSLIEGVLLTPPPYRNPEQLVLIQSVRTDGLPGLRAWPAQQWMEWQRQAQSFDAIAASHREVYEPGHRMRHAHYVGRLDEAGPDFDEAAIQTAIDLIRQQCPFPTRAEDQGGHRARLLRRAGSRIESDPHGSILYRVKSSRTNS